MERTTSVVAGFPKLVCQGPGRAPLTKFPSMYVGDAVVRVPHASTAVRRSQHDTNRNNIAWDQATRETQDCQRPGATWKRCFWKRITECVRFPRADHRSTRHNWVLVRSLRSFFPTSLCLDSNPRDAFGGIQRAYVGCPHPFVEDDRRVGCVAFSTCAGNFGRRAGENEARTRSESLAQRSEEFGSGEGRVERRR